MVTGCCRSKSTRSEHECEMDIDVRRFLRFVPPLPCPGGGQAVFETKPGPQPERQTTVLRKVASFGIPICCVTTPLFEHVSRGDLTCSFGVPTPRGGRKRNDNDTDEQNCSQGMGERGSKAYKVRWSAWASKFKWRRSALPRRCACGIDEPAFSPGWGPRGASILWTWNIREISHQVKMASAEEMEGKRAGIRRLVCDQVCCTRRSSAQEIFDAQKNPASSLRGYLPSQTVLAAGSAPPSSGS